MSTMADKVRAMMNDNGRTPQEAEAFRAKADELIQKHGLQWIWAELKAKQWAREQARAQAEKDAAKASKKGKGATDTRLRAVLVKNAVTGRWSTYKTCSKADLKATMKGLRAAGYTVKSKVLN